MNQSIYEQINFDEWKGRSSLAWELFVLNFRLRGEELPGLSLDIIRRSAPGQEQRWHSSTWTDGANRPDVRLLVDVYECRTRLEAHERLLDLLANAQLPTEDLTRTDAAGDIAFSKGKDHRLVFCRANLAISLSNAGRQSINVTSTAKHLDSLLLSNENGANLSPALSQKLDRKSFSTQDGERVLVGRADSDALSLPDASWYKFIANNGRFFIESGLLFWLPAMGGEHTLTRISVTPEK